MAILRRAGPIEAPAGFADRVVAAARPEHHRPPARGHRLARALFRPLGVKLPLQAAAVLLVAVTATWLARGGPEPPASAPGPASTRERTTALSDRTPAPEAPRPPEDRRLGGSRDRADTAREQAAAEGRGRSEPPERPASPAVRAEHGVAAKADAGAPGEIVRATWTVADRAAAARDVESLAARLGGAAVSRHDEGDVVVLELWLPEGAWDAAARELRRHGGLRVDPGPAPRGPVRAVLRITG